MKIPTYKTEGVIIRRFNFNEFDKLLVVYTKEQGKILVKAKSLRKKEAKLKETLELFNHVHLMVAKGKSMDTIAGTVILNSFSNLRSYLQSLAAVYYISELLDKLILAPEKDERVWELIAKTFYFLDSKEHSEQILKKLINRFEYLLISYLGYQPKKQQKSYLDVIQGICEEKIESRDFLAKVLVG